MNRRYGSDDMNDGKGMGDMAVKGIKKPFRITERLS